MRTWRKRTLSILLAVVLAISSMPTIAIADGETINGAGYTMEQGEDAPVPASAPSDQTTTSVTTEPTPSPSTEPSPEPSLVANTEPTPSPSTEPLPEPSPEASPEPNAEPTDTSVDVSEITAAHVAWEPKQAEQAAGETAEVTLSVSLEPENNAGVRNMKLAIRLTEEEFALLQQESLENTEISVEQEADGSAILRVELDIEHSSLEAELEFLAEDTLEEETAVDVTDEDITVELLDNAEEPVGAKTEIQCEKLTIYPLEPEVQYGDEVTLTVLWIDGGNQDSRPEVEDYLPELAFSADGGETFTALAQENLSEVGLTAMPEIQTSVSDNRWTFTVEAGVLPVWIPSSNEATSEGITLQWALRPAEISGYQILTPEEALEAGFSENWCYFMEKSSSLAANEESAAQPPTITPGDIKNETWSVQWLDNNNSSGIRPSTCPEGTIKFQIENGPVYELNEETMGLLGLEALPKVTYPENSSGFTLTASLPSTITVTYQSEEEEQEPEPEIKTVSWTVEFPDTVEGYVLQASEVSGTDFFYVETMDFVVTGTYHIGDIEVRLTDSNDIYRLFKLYVDEEEHGTLGDCCRDQTDFYYNLENKVGTITISDLPKYHQSGTLISYAIGMDGRRVEIAEELQNQYPDDYMEIYFDNTNVPNAGTLTDKIYNGGSYVLTLKGETTFAATKLWLDSGDVENRPTGTFQLWRYRLGEGYSTAAPAKDENGNFIEIDLIPEADEQQTISFGGLEKYDSDGYRYIYVVREYLDSTTADGEDAANYEQVFGEPKESEDGIYFVDTWVDETGKLVTGTHTGSRPITGTNLYNGGTLCNRITDTVATAARKNWKAAAFGGAFQDISVELGLFVSHKGEEGWSPALNESGDQITETLTKFQTESISSETHQRSMPKYDELGHELVYEWREIGVYQGEDSTENLLREDGTFVLHQDNRDIVYTSESELVTLENGENMTVITNSISNTVFYDVEKEWIDGVEPKDVTFDIWRTEHDGSSTRYASFTMKTDGTVELIAYAGESENVDQSNIVFDADDPYHATVLNLPEFDENGVQYTYIVLERAEGLHDIERWRDEDGNYYAKLINGPGEANYIFVHKIWLDESDLVHRGQVTLKVYDAETDEQIEVNGEPVEVTLNATNSWYEIVNIGLAEPDSVYILETQVGEVQVTNQGVGAAATAEYNNGVHDYEVFYDPCQQQFGYYFYTVTNRRVGQEDVTANKIWKAGEEQSELQKVMEENGLKLAFQVSLVDPPDASYQVTETGVEVGLEEYRTIPGFEQEQSISFEAEESNYGFYGLPAYDQHGIRLHYQVREIWLDENNQEISNAELQIQYPKVYEVWKEYTVSSTSTEVIEENGSGRDQLTVTYTNQRTGEKDISWSKVWKDAYSFDSGHRPDIYLDIYRVVHDAEGNPVTEPYLMDYKWEQDEKDSNTLWTVTLQDVRKYDDYGYEIFYYALEKSHINVENYDYQPVQYTHDGVSIGTAEKVEDQYLGDGGAAISVPENVNVRGFGSNYALKENGTFTNTIANVVTIEGLKIWSNLPAGYSDEDLPAIQVNINRYVEENGEIVKNDGVVATITIDNWGELDNYRFEVQYEGENQWVKQADGTWECVSAEQSPKPLPKYDEEGRLYTYSCGEIIINSDPNSSLGNDLSGVLYTPNIANYSIINPFESPKGALSVKKFLILPETPDEYPAVTFQLTRQYYSTSEGKWVEDTNFNAANHTITWSSAEVKAAHEAAKTDQPTGSVTLEQTLLFENLDIYSPNGYEYQYTVTERKEYLDGYDTYCGSGDLNAEQVTAEGVSVSNLELTENQADDSGRDGFGSTSETVAVSATFKNEQPENQRLVNLTGTKEWKDNNNQFEIRPEEITITLYRSADAQPGQDNAVAEEEVTLENGQLTWEKTENTWTYNIKDLECYADNGMPWKYRVQETVPLGYSASNNGSVTGTLNQDKTTYNMSTLTNTQQNTTVTFQKKWVNQNGAAITHDYLGLDLTVNFKLQVRTDGAAAWKDASEFFKDYPGEALKDESFIRSITGKLTQTGWSGSVMSLPRYVKIGTNVTELQYRMVETSVVYAGIEQTYTVVDAADGNSYTYDITPESGDGGLFDAYYDDSKSQSSASNVHQNELPTVSMTVTKKWEGDENNAYGARPANGSSGWRVSFVIQRSSDGGITWENVPNRNQSLVVSISGTDSENEKSTTVTDLPKCGVVNKKIVTYEYRAVELQAGETSPGTNNENCLLPENQNNVFHSTYDVAYSEVAFDETTQKYTAVITNKMKETITITAEKSWAVGNTTTSVTLMLQYKDSNGVWQNLRSVTLNGEADANPSKPYYENEAWKAIWTKVPEVYPGSQLTGGKTTYQVIEVPVPSGYICESTTPENMEGPWLFHNIEVVDVPVTKTWGNTNDSDRKPVEVTVGLFRIIEGGTEEAVLDDQGNQLTLTLTSGTKSFTNQPKYDKEGNAYTYYVRELTQNDNWTIVYQDKTGHGTNITNYYKTSVTGTKTWYDDNYQNRPESLTLTLYRQVSGGAKEVVTGVEPQWSKEGNKWTYTYTGLPYADDTGRKYTYSVEETVPENYHGYQSGNNFQNTIEISIEATKVWKDAAAVNSRPSQVTIELVKDGTPTGQTKTASAPTWSCTFEGLPKYDASGTLIQYTVRETSLGADYQSEVTGSMENGFTITNTLVGTTQVSGTKTWLDNSDGYETRPDDLTLTLYRQVDGGEKTEVADAVPAWTKPEGSNQWTYLYTGLAKYDEEGRAYIYSVEETEPDSYEKTLRNGNDFINTLTGTTEVRGTKTWVDNSDAYDTRPDSVVLTLYRTAENKTETVQIDPVWTKEGNQWSYVYSNLPKYNSHGVEYTYTVTETEPNGYVKTEAGFDITNTLTGTTEVRGTKTWLDNSNAYGTRPDSIVLTLYRHLDGQDESDKVAVTGAAPQWTEINSVTWSYEYTGLPEYNSEGVKYIYSVEETVPEGYLQTAQNGYHITNTLKTYVAASKIWKDIDGADSRPSQVTIELVKNGVPTGQTETMSAPDWTCTFTNLPMYDETGTRIEYTVTERNMDSNYQVQITGSMQDGFVVTNTLTGTTEVRGTKTWMDNSDAYGTRPESLTLTLYRQVEGGTAETVDTEPVWENTDTDQWTYTYSNLDQYDEEGRTYTYTVVETVPDGYTQTAQNGYDMTNTLTNTIAVSGEKVWLDDSNAEGLRPEAVTVVLYANGQELTRQTVTGTGDRWSYRFENLDEYDAQGKRIEYTVQELDSLELYRKSVDAYEITNLLTDYVDVTVQKIWHDDSNADGLRPSEITLELYANGELVRTAQVTGTGDQWTYTFTAMPKYDDTGKRIVYTVQETNVPDKYTVSYEDLVVTNTASDLTSVPVTKQWLDNSGAYGTRPETVTVSLYANGELFREEHFSGTGDQWEYVFEDLPKYDGYGKRITYTIQEDSVPEGYVVEQDGNVLTNILTGVRDVTVQKTWIDNSNALSSRPDEITVRLYANGEECGSAVMQASSEASGENGNTWSYTFKDLPQYDENGVEIVYTVEEDPVAGYMVQYEGLNIENTGFGGLSITKKVTGTAGDEKQSFAFTLTLSDSSVNGTYGDLEFTDGTAKFQLAHGQTVTVTGLPAGITYQVTETDANQNGYATTAEYAAGEIRPGEVITVSFENHKDAPKLPQTGQTNWPIPILGGTGLALLTGGCILRRKDKKRNT